MSTPRTLITGGAGFIGANLASRLLDEGHEVFVLDNLSRKGAEVNVSWLEDRAAATTGSLEVLKLDIRDADGVTKAFTDVRPTAIYHEAGQVAVTTSVTDPRRDFEENALGTFNVLEGLRALGGDTPFIFASTNKVYGGMEEARVELGADGRYQFADLPEGCPETWPLDFHSPYGCSKGAADQYVRDYARIYGLRTVVFRQSCVYGYRQFGVEDQGWIAWFTIATALGKPITIFGDGRQVRDALFIDDLVDAYLAATRHIDKTAGGVFNIGGGATHTLSLLELLEILGEIRGAEIGFESADWRPGDQRVFVADVTQAANTFGWRPTTGPKAGVRQLARWVDDNLDLLRGMF